MKESTHASDSTYVNASSVDLRDLPNFQNLPWVSATQRPVNHTLCITSRTLRQNRAKNPYAQGCVL